MSSALDTEATVSRPVAKRMFALYSSKEGLTLYKQKTSNPKPDRYNFTIFWVKTRVGFISFCKPHEFPFGFHPQWIHYLSQPKNDRSPLHNADSTFVLPEKTEPPTRPVTRDGNSWHINISGNPT